MDWTSARDAWGTSLASLFREPDEPKLGQRRWPKLDISAALLTYE